MRTQVMVFSGRDPVMSRMWRCVDPHDAACAAALAAPAPDVCGIPRSSWQWTARYASHGSVPLLLLRRAKGWGHATSHEMQIIVQPDHDAGLEDLLPTGCIILCTVCSHARRCAGPCCLN